jgi:hypothetical protein
MKTEPPSFRRDFKLTIAQRLSELSIIDDIDEMLRDGVSTGDVAKFIQLGLEELLDVKVKTLGKVLGQRRKDILVVRSNVMLDDRLAAIMPAKCRPSACLSRNQYDSQQKLLDRLIEAQAVYLFQRDRMDWIGKQEQVLGFPFEMTDRSVMTALKALEIYGKAEKELLERVGSGLSHPKLDIKGYSKETSEVLRRPDSRRRVISLVERLKTIGGPKEIPKLDDASGE